MNAEHTKARPLRVLAVVTTRYAKNGITGVVKNLAAGIRPGEAVVDYALINEIEADERAAIEQKGGRVFVFPYRNRRPLAYLFALARLVRKNRCDVVHAHGNSATMAAEMLAALLGGARVRIAHAHNTACTHEKLHALLTPLFSRCTTHALACGAEAGRFLFGTRPFIVLKNGVDASRFAFDSAARSAARAELGLDGRLAFGSVASLTERKNHAFLLEAFKYIYEREPSAALLLAGTGPLEEPLRALARELGIADGVRFLGDITDVSALYLALDALLMPSLCEGLPLVLVEAQCAALPCLASDGVPREADLTGLVSFLPLSAGASAWAENALRLPTPDEARALRAPDALAAVRAAGYDRKSAASELLALYRAAVEEGA